MLSNFSVEQLSVEQFGVEQFGVEQFRVEQYRCLRSRCCATLGALLTVQQHVGGISVVISEEVRKSVLSSLVCEVSN